ncbi:MAG TPA: UDP-N-acetylglucosamine 4,6-dehydratase [Defluviitoga tunisiensis]|nr:UDP-N-acetylglucosamine 4,6-dehydratase [Defluviitoga tunisiensis]
MNILQLIGRDKKLFEKDIEKFEDLLEEEISKSSFLVIGGAGSIGNATVKEIFKRKPKLLHVVDINENTMVELVRDIRSSLGYIEGEFKTFCIDAGDIIFEKFFEDFGRYDYVLNFSALKHVRSEKDPYTLMRMIQTNVLNTIKTLDMAINKKVKKYFCVSTDKAANPVNMMGASKRIMELYLMKYSEFIDISTARFANVAFSDGSLLDGFRYRIEKKQPLSAPSDIKRYFIIPEESGLLCLFSTILGRNKELFFPKLSENLHLITFSQIVVKFLEYLGYEPYICDTEDEARELVKTLPAKGKWPCYFFISDTTGEKDFEEFYTSDEVIDWDRFEDIGVIKSQLNIDINRLDYFAKKIDELLKYGWQKTDLVQLFNYMLPNFAHKETGKYLDQRM